MTSPSPDFSSHRLLERARQGDQEAWQALFDDCYPKIVRVVHRQLRHPMRKLYDSTDIANDVMKSLAAKFDAFKFSSINGLRAFLIQAAEKKLIDRNRRGNALKRDLSRDRPLSASDKAVAWEPADGSPTASQVAMASEELGNFLDGQTGENRDVLELKLKGFSNAEVARLTGWHLRKVERFLEKQRGSWQS